MKNQPFTKCPSFRICSVNNCPLHPKYPNLTTCSGDTEKKCRAQKPTRIKISEEHSGVLKLGGLTEKEHNLKLLRENRTPEEWEILRLRAKKARNSKAYRKQKGKKRVPV